IQACRVRNVESDVPTRVRAIVERGLAADPASRFPSMSALLAALDKAIGSSKRRLRLTTAIAGSLVLLSAGAFVHRRMTSAQSLCGAAGERITEVWNPDAKRAIRDAFLATGRSYAKPGWSSVERTFDRYAQSWSAQRVDACMATRVRGEQSSELFDLRMQCLDGRREELRALIDLFAHADASVIDKAAQSAQSVSSLDECTNVV